MVNGYIYILKLREHVKNKEKIFKVGRTENIKNRIRQYPKGSVLLYTIYTENIIEKEKKILKELSDKIKLDYGLEYFGCDLAYIRNIIDNNISLLDCEELISKKDKLIDDEILNSKKEKKKKQDTETKKKANKDKLLTNKFS